MTTHTIHEAIAEAKATIAGDCDGMKNTERIYRALLYYCQSDDEKDVATNIVDMIADLMHLADEYGDGAADATERAREHYSEERAELEGVEA